MLLQRLLLYALAHTAPDVDYERPPAGYPPGSQYSMPGLLGGLPMNRRHHPVPFDATSREWAHGGFVPGAQAALPEHLHHEPPPPYRFEPDSAPSMPEPVSWPHAEFIGNFAPPATADEEHAQLQLALECSRHDHYRQPIENFLDHLDQHASASDHDRPTRFDELPEDVRSLYANEFEYDQEVTASVMNHAPVEEALGKARLQAVPNDGRIGESINNCFLISVTQHVRGEYDSSHDDDVDFMRAVLDGDEHARAEARELSPEHRRILDNAPDVRLDKDAKISSRGAEAKLAVDLMNANRKYEDRVDVWIVSMVDGKAHVDKLESGSPSARVVAIWDKGGHFEAITPLLQPAL